MNLVIQACGPLLPDITRHSIEACIGHALLCMAKGIQTALPTDRRMRRCSCEPIRSDSTLQTLILKMATTEIMSVFKGKISGNIPTLRRAAEACLGGNITLVSTARNALLVIESLTHPVGVLLPPVPVDLLVQDALHQRDEALQSQREILDRRVSPSAATYSSLTVNDQTDSALHESSN